MKYLTLIIVFLCILITPVFYTTTLTVLEKHLEPIYQKKIENRVIGDPKPILDGSIAVHDAVNKNIRDFLAKDFFVNKFNLNLDILISGKGGSVIYPSFEKFNPQMPDNYEKWNANQIARNNYNILSRKLIVKVIVRLRHGTLGANLILIFYIVLSLSIFTIYYQYVSARARKEEQRKNKRLVELMDDEKAQNIILQKIASERFDLLEKLKNMKAALKEKNEKASITEEEMFEEIISLETKLNANIEKQKKKEEEIEVLKNKLKETEKSKGGRKKRKLYDTFTRRFSTLYKNVDMNKKALSGLFELNEDLQIKAEEVIHQLNEDAAKVTIKRKVFSGKKHKTASFEVLFAYNGRLYFRNTEGNRIEVLVIGTKNTQDKDMEFLHSV